MRSFFAEWGMIVIFPLTVAVAAGPSMTALEIRGAIAFGLIAQRARFPLASSASGAISEESQDDDDRDESDSTNAHHAGVSDRSRPFGLDSGYGSDCSDDDRETKPD